REGATTCRKIEAGLTAKGYDCSAFGKDMFAEEAGITPLKNSLDEWTADSFPKNDALVFVGACGIAVRAIAPYIKDKTVDPAVVVIDEKGMYAISLLSGHLGGANDIAREIAEIVGAEPVITTATDLNHRFAADDWAKKNHLSLGNMQIAKEISAAILRGETIGVASEFPIEGQLPEQLQYVSEAKDSAAINDLKIGFRISIHEEDGPFEKTLHLIPKTVSVGIGCRKGVSQETVEELLDKVLKEHKLSVKSIEKLCSIDIKKEEAALNQLAAKLGIPLQVFSAAELEKLTGEFTASEFVNHITGVDNVCERTAVMGSHGELIVKKQAMNGVTVALAVRKEQYKWMQQ
ncbi:MAG TPA: cobalt-precorrin 5A hydrolase, partial [Anaerovoracaceae bacterium]|nr:cobalt-precorrin 5A hydrolase [Anaerovoracaceae bacterium]